MASFGDVIALVPALRDMGDGAMTAGGLPAVLAEVADEVALSVLAEASEIVRCAEQMRSVAAAVIQARSARERGHAGLAQAQGHSSATALVRDVTGTTRAEAARLVRVGSSLLEAAEGADAGTGAEAGTGADAGSGADPASEGPRPVVWHAPLARAVHDGTLTLAQQDAIRRGLGEPPTEGIAEQDAAWRETWQTAAEQLITEASQRTVEELTSAARSIRDTLDSEGARRRYLERFEARSFRVWTDRDGLRHGSIVFDDDGYAMVAAIQDSALRPRRGGPRFVDPDEQAAAGELVADPRTNDHLAYDLFLDLMTAGMFADAATVFGARRPGVRVVTVERANPVTGESELGGGHTEDRLVSLPGRTIEQHVCDTGIVPVTIDQHGNPLRIGRAQRLFTPPQRVALAVRDGGCRWPSCDRPASYGEAHHIDPWNSGGRTDVDRGILLCRFHHMQLHHGRWRISREGLGDFTLHHPDGASTVLETRRALTYAWAGIDPPPRRFRPG